MTDEREKSGRTLEEEGVPDLEGPLVEKEITGDPQEGVAPPNYRPKASTDWGTTAEEQRQGEPLDLRIAREQPDVGAGDVATDPDAWERPVRLTDEADSDVGVRDDEAEMLGSDSGDEPDDFSAEELAMREERE
jgi:hypothetical protein